jgi:Ca-activated chloride channel family protein
MASGTSGQTGSHPADDAEQARRDTAASVGQRNGPVASDGKPALQGRPTEQQLAQQQWLRAIPDDPGGLLRRKFLIEHMLRQQKGQP